MAKILIPTRVRYAFAGGVSEMIQMLGTVSQRSGHSLIDLDRTIIAGRYPYHPRTLMLVLMRRLAHLKTLAFFESYFPRIGMVFFQTSLGSNSLRRDVAYMRRCSKTGRPFAVFVHGWDERFATKLSKSPSCYRNLANTLNQAKRIFVLAPSFAETLSSWGVKSGKVSIETTMIDDSILKGFDIGRKAASRTHRQGLRILFMSRIVREKGVYETVEAFRLHRRNWPSSSLVIAGVGRELEAVKAKVQRDSIQNVHFAGFVEGVEKRSLFTDADVFLFPSFYGEGLPIVLLEAMALGCTLVTRPVGGVDHLFRSPEMGYLEASLEPGRYAAILNELAANPESWAEAARFNHQFAKQNTLASRVGQRILDEVIRDAG